MTCHHVAHGERCGTALIFDEGKTGYPISKVFYLQYVLYKSSICNAYKKICTASTTRLFVKGERKVKALLLLGDAVQIEDL